MYNNYNNYNGGGYRSGGGYGRGNYRNGGGYNGGGYNGGNAGNRQAKKRSGCTRGFSNGDQASPYVRGWNASKVHGITSIICGPYKKTKNVTSKSGKTWENWVAKVQVGRGKEYLTDCMYDVQKGRVIIQSLGFVLNPNTNYCGTFSKRK